MFDNQDTFDLHSRGYLRQLSYKIRIEGAMWVDPYANISATKLLYFMKRALSFCTKCKTRLEEVEKPGSSRTCK
jgi:hypothetical protein